MSILVQDQIFFVYEHRLNDIRIVSSDSKAVWGGPLRKLGSFAEQVFTPHS